MRQPHARGAFDGFGVLVYVMRYYQRLLPIMVAAQHEWNGEVMPQEQG